MSTPATPSPLSRSAEENARAKPSDRATPEKTSQREQHHLQELMMIGQLRRRGYHVNSPPELDETVVRQEAPDAFGKPAPIWRTIISSEGPVLNRVQKYTPVNEDDYYSIRDKDLGSAIELVKSVSIIPSDQTALQHRQRGNAALGDAIVQGVTTEKIVVRCPLLLEAIRRIIYWPSAAFQTRSRTLEFNTPYRAIGAHRRQFAQYQAELEKEIENQPPSTHLSHTEPDVSTSAEEDRHKDCLVLLDHLKLFLGQVDRVQEDGIYAEQERNKRGLVSFDYLWVLYSPGKLVYVEIDEVMVACCIRLLIWGEGGQTSEDSYGKVQLHVWFLDHDGATLNRRQHHVDIFRFEGAKPVSELSVRPEASMPKELRQEKEMRGRRYIDFISEGFSICSYKGSLSTALLDPCDRASHSKFTGTVVVDPVYYYRGHSQPKGMKWVDDRDTHSGTLGAEMKQFVKVKPSSPESQFSDKFYFLLSDWICGFTISTHGDRKWAWFHIENLQKYEFDRDLWYSVALSDQDREDIRALTQRSSSGQSPDSDQFGQAFSPDCIAYKGEGCVILLHGSPGLGKTYTAECIAEHTKRPLLRLTCAELGLEPKELEQALRKHLRMAERWNAIVLIDEADVYTSKRTSNSPIQREAIVAVLLRSLEYFSGILFLTTNRVDNFDAAVIDRVDLIVRFRALNSSQRRKIRQNCITRLIREDNVTLDSEAQSALEKIDYDSYEWNGREIVQVFKLAGRLAQSRHFETIEETRPPKPIITLTVAERAQALTKRHTIYKVSQGLMDEAETPTKGEIYKRDQLG